MDKNSSEGLIISTTSHGTSLSIELLNYKIPQEVYFFQKISYICECNAECIKYWILHMTIEKLKFMHMKYMGKWIFLYLLIQVSVWTNAQNREVIEATSGEDLNKKVSTQMQYLFPEFTDGYVFYTGLPRSSGKLNYNILLGEMQFMDAENKILALDNVPEIQIISIGSRKFYPYDNKEFVEELLVAGKIQLQIRRRGNVASHSKKGAYGMTSSTSAISSYRNIDGVDRTYNLAVVENVMITLNQFYYLVINNKRIQIKNRKTFLKQFPQHKIQIETFVNERSIRFDSEEDLKILVKYCSTL